MQEAVARRDSRRVMSETDPTEMQNRKIMKDAAALENKLKSDGKSDTEVAKAMQDKYGSPVTADDIKNGMTWWSEISHSTASAEKAATAAEKGTYQGGLMSNSGGLRWLPDRVQELTHLKAQGFTVKQIAQIITKRFGVAVSEDAVRQQINIHGIGGKVIWTPDMDAALLRMYARGDTGAKISKSFNDTFGKFVGATAIERRVQTLQTAERQSRGELKRGNRGSEWPPDAEAIMRGNEIKGLSYSQIGQLLEDRTGNIYSRGAIAGKLMRIRNEPSFALQAEAGDILNALRQNIERSKADDIAATILNLCKAA